MAATFQLGSAGRHAGKAKEIPANLKAWLDQVIVPALVDEYLAEREADNLLAESRCDAAESKQPGEAAA